MANPSTLKPWTQRTADEALSDNTLQWMDWITKAMNQLIGQPVTGAAGVAALAPNIIDPRTAQLISGGSRTQSLTTAIKAIAQTNSVSFFWDGTNGSSPITIYRDDGSIITPITGNQVVTGLSPSTTYFFYPYYDETLGKVAFAFVSGVSIGTPGFAFTAQNPLALQQQFLRNRIPLSGNFATTGITTPGAGSTNFSGGSGGGGGSGFGGKGLQ